MYIAKTHRTMNVHFDVMEECICNIYHNYIGGNIVRDVKAIGFAFDHKLHNMIAYDNVEYEEHNFTLTTIPGTCLFECEQYMLDRKSYIHTADYSRSIIITVNNAHDAAQSCDVVHPHIVYNGDVLLVVAISVADNKRLFACKYEHVVLQLYRQLTGTRMSIACCMSEALSFMNMAAMDKYIPVTCSYFEMIEKVAIANTTDDTVILNPKYNGRPCWLYMSQNTPPSLIAQYRTRSANEYKYIGRLYSNVCEYKGRQCAILAESICSGYDIHTTRHIVQAANEMSTNMLSDANIAVNNVIYVAIDICEKYDSSTEYYDRLVKLRNVLSLFNYTFMHSDGSPLHLCVTSSNVLRLSTNKHDDIAIYSDLLECINPITSIMTTTMQHVDGYVLYLGNNRPMKVKLAESLTVDLECVKAEDGTITYDVNNSHLRSIVNDVGGVLDLAECDRTYIVEVSINNGAVTSIRNDRLSANPSNVVNNIVSKYMSDKKYSLSDVWSGRNIKLLILMNRVFKTFCYNRFVPAQSRIVDMGSGNGADVYIWRDKGYKVLAVERDEKRLSILKRKVHSHIDIICKLCDMRCVMRLLSDSTMKYRYTTFMRSIGHLSLNEIRTLFVALRKYGMVRIVVVTALRELVYDADVADHNGQRFNVHIRDDGMIVTKYSIDNRRMSYVDNCYTHSEWSNIAKDASYRLNIFREETFIADVYHCEQEALLKPCTMDVCLTFDSS